MSSGRSDLDAGLQEEDGIQVEQGVCDNGHADATSAFVGQGENETDDQQRHEGNEIAVHGSEYKRGGPRATQRGVRSRR